MTVLTFNIKKVSDKIRNAWLINQPWDHDIFLPIIRWVASFLNNCTTIVQLDEEIGDQESVKIGVPQGSLVASILFILFTALLFQILTKEEKEARIKICSYVNNGFLTAKALKKSTTTTKIQETFAKIKARTTQNGMVFDQAKFEAIRFSQKKYFPNSKIVLLPTSTVSMEKKP